MLSAAFIMAANSWMQHPVGYQMNNGKAELTNIWAVLTNPVFLWGYAHVLLAAVVTGSVVMLAVSAWHLRRGSDTDLFARSARLALVVLAPAAFLGMIVGSVLGVVEDKYQPMKIAASEAQWETCQPCSFSLFQIGGGNRDPRHLDIPHLGLLVRGGMRRQTVRVLRLGRVVVAVAGPGREGQQDARRLGRAHRVALAGLEQDDRALRAGSRAARARGTRCCRARRG